MEPSDKQEGEHAGTRKRQIDVLLMRMWCLSTAVVPLLVVGQQETANILNIADLELLILKSRPVAGNRASRSAMHRDH
jgi:hypothetical protein